MANLDAKGRDIDTLIAIPSFQPKLESHFPFSAAAKARKIPAVAGMTM